MKIIGLTSQFSNNHDNSIALLEDGELLFAQAEERASKKKHDLSFPVLSMEDAFRFTNWKLKHVDYFVTTSSPMSLYTSLAYYKAYFEGIRYCGVWNFLTWFFQRAFSIVRYSDPQTITLKNFVKDDSKILCVSHADAHAATAYWCGPHDHCLVVALDGFGTNADGRPNCGKIFLGKNNQLQELEEVPIYASLALYYGAVTVGLGFKLNDGEGKTMGLAVYGEPEKCLKEMRKFFPDFIDGKWVGRSSWLEVNSVSTIEFFSKTKTFSYLKDLVEKYGDRHVAAAAQQVLEERVLKFFKYLQKKYKLNTFSAAGGLFLNVKMSMKLLNEGKVKDLWVYPNPGDSGIAVGAALLGYQKVSQQLRRSELKRADFGRSFSNAEIKIALDKFKKQVSFKSFPRKTFLTKVATEIVSGKVIGWFQGRGEWGPRALGQRSALADPRGPHIREKINDVMKRRDWFMPFAPSVMKDRASEYFMNLKDSPFMILADFVFPKKAKKIPAVIHVDNTCRPQFVDKKVNPLYYDLIAEFEKQTGVPMVLNTSFNKHGLPIVYEPADAVEHLLWGCVDALAIGSYIVTRKEQKILQSEI